MFGSSVAVSPGCCGTSNSYTPCSHCSASADSGAETSRQHTPSKDTFSKTTASPTELTPEEEQQVAELKQRDREVKAHEAAHMAAGGGYVRGGVSYSYQSGPDGKRYAVGGEVSIDTSPEDDPNATIRKMQAVKSAALAPANPSGQDRAVASAAASQEAQARRQLHASDSPDKSRTEKPSIGNHKTRSYTPDGKQTPPAALPEIDLTG